MSITFGISKFENKRVLIVGDIMLDEFVYTTSNRNSPEYKEVPVLQIQDKKQYLGGAANVALNIKKLNAIPYLVGVVGNDENAQVIYKKLAEENISNQYIYTNTRQKTTTKSRIFQENKPIYRIDAEEKMNLEILVNHFILKNIQDAINNHKPHILILQDYNKGVLNSDNIPEIIEIAKKNNLIICVDPKLENWNLYQAVDLFKPNLNEFNFMSTDYLNASDYLNAYKASNNQNIVDASDISNNQNSANVSDSSNIQTLLKCSEYLKNKLNFKNLLVTLGAEGNFIFDGKNSQISPLKSHLANPDVCGAGDTVIAIAALALASGFTLEETAILANKAGYLVCQKEHIQPITISELAN